ncbi:MULTISPECIES: helix-turn-helix domain-containing protein [unclassified Rathayibacter]|uniref:helix-turn-helix domain-containing protein n=1 Tax=unclassified Rathayibacter TaxID=2609250 RepID=UPI000A46BA83|nr:MULTISPECIES: helix-turn-helix transcriptional regulator [unclassified Rathayibacter]
MTTPDEQIGSNLIKLRGDMTQRELAEKMRQRGWKWTHVTVGSVERGERPLRLSEAQAVVGAIGRGFVEDLLSSEADATVRAWMHKMTEANAEIERVVREYVDTQFHLAVAAWNASLNEQSGVGMSVLDWVGNSPVRSVKATLERIRSEEEVESQLGDRLYGKLDETAGTDVSGTVFFKALNSWQSDGEHSEAP